MTTVVDNVADAFELQVIGKVRSREQFINEFARITQYITWPLLYLLFHGIFHLHIRGEQIFRKVKGPFVIITNHISFYNSFLFRLVLGPFTKHLPLRFMAVSHFEGKALNYLAKFGIIDFVYSLFGVFTVVPGLGIDKNIRKAKEIIRIKGNLVIYPEGRITRDGGVGPFKKGAAVLERETGVRIIPVSFRLGRRNCLRRTMTVNVGEEIVISGYRSIDETTQIYHKVVSRLYGRE